MSRNIDGACTKYEVKLRLGRGSKSRYVTIEEQVEHFRQAQVRDAELVSMVKEVICKHPVPTILFPYYYVFARKVAKFMRKFGGETLLVQVGLLRDYWHARGLDRTILNQVCAEVFEVEVEV